MYGYCWEKIDVGHYWDLKQLTKANAHWVVLWASTSKL